MVAKRHLHFAFCILLFDFSEAMADLLSSKATMGSKIDVTVRSTVPLLIYAGVALLVLEGAAYGGLFVLNRYQASALEELTAEIESKAEIRPEAINQVFLLDSRLRDMRTILSQRLFLTPIFSFLESTTNPRVRFLNFNFRADTRRLDMSGEAAGYATLARQIALLEGDPRIERVEFGNLALDQNNILRFQTTIIFTPSFFRASLSSPLTPNP